MTIDPRKLVVWVLLHGPQATLPQWYVPHLHRRPDHIGPGILSAIDGIRAAIVARFHAGGWPDTHHLMVSFDSTDRVHRHGGLRYFD